MRIPILKTAFAGLGLLRERPDLTAGLALAQAGIYLALAMLPLAPGVSADVPARGGQGMGLLGLQALLVVTGHSIAACAVLRAVLRPDERGLLGLKLGLDELRMTALVLLFMAGLAALILAGWFVASLLTMGRSGASGGLAGLVLNLVTILPILAWFALAGPRTFVGRRLALPSAVKMVRGRYWPIAGAMAIAAAVSTVIYFVMLVLFGMFGSMAMFETEFSKVWSIDYSAFAGIFTSGRMILWGLGVVAGTITTLMWTGLGASVYRRIADSDPRQQAEVFA